MYLLENMLPIRLGFVLTSTSLVSNGPSIAYNPSVTKKKLPAITMNVPATGEQLAALVHMAEHSQEGCVHILLSNSCLLLSSSPSLPWPPTRKASSSSALT